MYYEVPDYLIKRKQSNLKYILILIAIVLFAGLAGSADLAIIKAIGY